MPVHRHLDRRRAPDRAFAILAACLLAQPGLAARAPARSMHPAASTPSSPSAPAQVGQAAPADAQALQHQLDALFATVPVASGKVSIEVRSLADGRVLYARNAADLLNPASNTKVATAAAALLKLGPDYRFSTDVLADHAYAHGKAKTLYVKGRGDPSINSERLEAIARDLALRGVSQVGDLILDDTFFDNNPWGPGWESETSDKPWAAPMGALSLNHNSVGIYVVPADKPGQKAHVSLDPEARGFFELANSVQTARANQRKRALPHSYAIGERTRITVSGRIPIGSEPIILYRRVTDPTLYFGFAFKQLLQQHGIKVTGALKRGAVPADAKFITSYDSPELGEVVREMNKASSNFIAEMLVKTLGAELQGAPGTWPKGVAAMQDALAELGLPKGSYQLKNGSGLNDTNRFSSHQLVDLLATLYARFPLAAEFVASLPVAGRDGSLRLRMDGTEAAGRLRAKTGTLDRAVALSGFLQDASGEALVFSLMVNDWNGKVPPIIKVADRVGVLLASLGERPAERQAQLAEEVAVELPADEQKARIANYGALAQARDKKNLASLRSAVRAERDPLVRLAAAEALIRTDTESGAGPFLDALSQSAELFPRLRAAAQELKLPLPIIPALLDLAADGSADALARLLALCPQADGAVPDEELRAALADGLADVSEASPEETLAALKSAPVDQARAAAALIGLGFAVGGVEMDDSSFAQLVLASAARSDGDATEARLWVRLLERRGQRAAPESLNGG